MNSRSSSFRVASIAILLSLACGLSVGASAEDEPFVVDAMPRDLEIDYALSALPSHLRQGATGFLATMNLPHYMFYAPGVTDSDIGGQYGSSHPFIIYPGPHGFMIKLAAPTEKEAINKEQANLIQRLYEHNEKLYLPGVTRR